MSFLNILTEPIFVQWTIKWTLVITVFALIISFIRHVRRDREKFQNLPTIAYSPIMGNLLGFLELYWTLKLDRSFTAFLYEMILGGCKMCHLRNDGVIYFRIGPLRNVVVFVSAKETEVLLSHTRNILKAQEYAFMKPWLGEGLLTGGGVHWRKHRKLLTPTFHFAILNKFIPVMNGQLKTLLEIIESKMQDEKSCGVVEDIRPLIINCTIDVICQTAMGIKANAQYDWIQSRNGHTKESIYVESVKNYLDMVVTRIVTPWYHPDWMFNLTPAGWRFKKIVSSLHNFTNEVIRVRKEELSKSFDSKLTFDEAVEKLSSGENRKRLAFLDLLLMYHLKDPKEFDLTSIREEVDTFMFGGHDTTSSTLHFALFLIGHHPEKQKLIHEELDSVFGEDYDRDVTEDDVKHLKYLEMCIKETLRLYPPAVIFARTITEPFQCGDYFIPDNCTAVVASYGVHHDPLVYEKSAHFIPERFAPESPVLKHSFAFIPFSAGPRNCIGQKFAMLELKIFLATILRKYQIRTVTKEADLVVELSIISKVANLIEIEFTKRT